MLRDFTKDVLHRFGYDMKRYDPRLAPHARLLRGLQLHGVDLVLDVGANVGQFAHDLRTSGFKGKIVSFEPLSKAWSALSAASQHDPQWTVAPRCAIGSRDGETEIHISENLYSSSVLNILEAHTRFAPASAYVGVETVPLRRLDSAAAPFLDPASKIFLKIDTQGFESEVLAGAPDLLQRAVGVLVEVSMTPLYDGQKLFHELMPSLWNTGLRVWDIQGGLHDPESGRILQSDIILFRA